MQRSSLVIVLVVGLLAVAEPTPAAPAKAPPAKAPPAKPSGTPNSCLAGGCHAKISGYLKKHTALRTGCSSCHRMADHKRMRFVLVASGRRLCNLCHSWPKKLKVRHSAFAQAQCTLCHDPHGSSRKAHLKASEPELCGTCHPSSRKSKRQHAPFKAGACSRCHNAHGAQHAGLLRKGQKALCADCHAKTIATFTGAYRHAPVDQGLCTGCHSPHQADHKHLLPKPSVELCATCHKKYPPSKVKHQHEAMEQGCPTCHRPHASKNPKLLSLKQPNLCYTCHERKDKDKVVHSAVKLGRCSGCHDPHGSANKTLMRAARLGDVCFKCHCDDVTRRKSVHWPVKGRVCDRCHGSHGAPQPKLLKVSKRLLCDSCHADKRIPKGVRGHGAQLRAGCSACHDAHGSPTAALLKGQVNRLCSTCHPKQRSGTHIFAGPGGRGHPVAGKPDPLYRGRVLSCVSCHAMSSSVGPKLMRAASREKLCRRCHAGGTRKLKPEWRTDGPAHHYPRGRRVTPPRSAVGPTTKPAQPSKPASRIKP